MADDDNSADGDVNPFDILDQSEIDNLLNSSEVVEEQIMLRADGTRMTGATLPKVEDYDFRNPVFLTEVELRRLRLIHEEFIRYLQAKLSLVLRMEFSLKMAKLTTLTYTKFCEGLPNPTHLCLFKVDPLTGVGVLDFNTRLALTVVDRLLGGRGHSVKAERYLTEIEISLLEDVIKEILDQWCHQWKWDKEMHPHLIGHETNGRFLQTSPRDAIVLLLSMEAAFGDCSEQITIGVPYYMIEPMVKSIHARRAKDTQPVTVHIPEAMSPLCEHITMPVRAEWPAFETSLRELLALRPGDLLQLPTKITEETHITLNGTPKFVGQVGLEGDHVAVTLTKNLPSQEP
ncbi:flagellar motor switch protein FliM [Actomonas aquatica]|uniref:Flagellar motor switch protein FliM n=1 Tax=Actomonas aquatica TaxID=2866162 RepID=A0ABZ1CDE9_9BACT|nr:FliM/FliN family flagellar motor switch protein [Opitutus sp. WL0086]WRQ89273.1 FliM/FliN family flagellar motor switch protein [Opitutus sp. WL0086]